jgi:hypothetical protein
MRTMSVPARFAGSARLSIQDYICAPGVAVRRRTGTVADTNAFPTRRSGAGMYEETIERPKLSWREYDFAA